jgi:hypothetical protein
VTCDRSVVRTPIFINNKTDCHDITEKILKMALKTDIPNLNLYIAMNNEYI